MDEYGGRLHRQKRFARATWWRAAALVLIGTYTVCLAGPSAQGVFTRLERNIYQVRTVDHATGKKSVIGSGFQVSPQGHVVTNFHVVAENVEHPEETALELVNNAGGTTPLRVRGIDVVNDLAIVIADSATDGYLRLGSSRLPKGAQIYALGNPRDLGLTIVEGTYNGDLQNHRYRKLLFSGALNGGMSGGPAVDEHGRVVGVAVARLAFSDDLGFLVPVEYVDTLLAACLADSSPCDIPFDSLIQQQLLEHQRTYLEQLVGDTWELDTLGDIVVPGEMAPSFKCWGSSEKDKDRRYDYAQTTCGTYEKVYLGEMQTTGSIEYEYHWLQNRDLNAFQFSRLYTSVFTRLRPSGYHDEDLYTRYECNTDIVDIGGTRWKAVFCLRSYRRFPRLYDFVTAMALLDGNRRGVALRLVVSGVDEELGFALSRKLMDTVGCTE